MSEDMTFNVEGWENLPNYDATVAYRFFVGIWDNDPVDNPIADYDRAWSMENE